ncbi:hypothetical protein EST38_g4310 [Candolleomyces aberdarensis]|uniref:Fungal-type protein kinase domain-containing protein n=1 Tax=Candolleomyces aberdarensis TaxID=2316362 RepID=A0A4V1Q4C0_9AGAR|nr:hypothetical protein EST38_g4310 [Candolleomyces aberdarensis]
MSLTCPTFELPSSKHVHHLATFVVGHSKAWKEGSLLRRNLSDNNLVLHLDKDRKAKGVADDCDMASSKDALGKIDSLLATHHRTGTSPFMAVDLLDDNSHPHLYRHELESLFYVLLWGALHYEVSAGVRHPTLKVMKKWEGEHASVGNAKDAFFGNPDKAKTILDAIRPEFHELRDEWIEPLYWLIKDARNSVPVRRPGRKPPAEAYDRDTYGGNLTFRTFMQAINENSRWAEEKETKEKHN